MTTYYVAKTGNDANAGTDPAAPKLTIGSAIGVASTTGDVVEIIDEGTYSENTLRVFTSQLTIRHTASVLGRPVIDSTGGGQFAEVYGEFLTLIGLEIKGGTSQTLKLGDGDYHKFHLSGCFIHETPRLGSNVFNNTSGTPSTIKQSVLYFDGTAVGSPINCQSGLEISNCLITASAGTIPVLQGYSTTTNTASFSTIIHRGTSNTGLIVAGWSKVINCIVTGSGKGIGSDDHTYNLLDVSGEDFRNYADSSNGSAGTGDIIDTDPLFINGSAEGSAASIAGNYNLQSSSPAIDVGTSFDSIRVDISGTTRPQGSDPDIGCFEFVSAEEIWSEYTTEPTSNFSEDFTIQGYTNLSSNHKFRNAANTKQAPFSMGVKGPVNIRNRSTGYKVTK
jgi:hypothetical protein